MKQVDFLYKIFIVLFFSFCYSVSIFGQQVPICDVARYKDQYTDNAKWNSLVLKACEEIQRKEFSKAYYTMRQVITEDSINSNGIKTAYLETQLNKLVNYIQENNVKLETATTSESAPSEPVVKKEEPKKEEVKAETQHVSKKEEPKKDEVKAETQHVSKKEEPKKVEQISEPKPVVTKEEPKKVEEKSNPAVIKEETAEKQVEEKEPNVEKDGDETTETAATSEIKFNDQDKVVFQEKGLQKVKQLETFIVQIGNKNTPQSSALMATTGALKLFDSEERTVQISSANSGEVKRSKIKSYLQKLRLLNYSNVNIEWADFQYASDFKKGLDGNYYGYIIFKQRFTASSLDNQITYKDLTTKKVEIILKSYEKAAQGEVTQAWDIFLGDISVVQTEGN
jgi:hypothetical protein